MKSIDVISIPVTDQARSRQFYEALGFELLAETPMGKGQTWLQMELPGTFTSIILVTWFKKMPPGSLQGLTIRTESIQTDVETLKKKGYEVGQIEETPLGKFVSFKDPDGNGLSLQQRV